MTASKTNIRENERKNVHTTQMSNNLFNNRIHKYPTRIVKDYIIYKAGYQLYGMNETPTLNITNLLHTPEMSSNQD